MGYWKAQIRVPQISNQFACCPPLRMLRLPFPLPLREGANDLSAAKIVRGRGDLGPLPQAFLARSKCLPPPARGGGILHCFDGLYRVLDAKKAMIAPNTIIAS